VGDLQPADERECRDVLTAGGHGQLALKVSDIRFEVVALPHLDDEKMVVILLSFPMRCILGDERIKQL